MIGVYLCNLIGLFSCVCVVFPSYFSTLSHFRVFVGLLGYWSKEVHFGVFWSDFGPMMDWTCILGLLEQFWA